MAGVSKYFKPEYINKQINNLTILEFIDSSDERNDEGAPAFLCRCICGNEVIKKASHVIKGNIRSCGECHETRSKYADKSYIGKQFNHLKIIKSYYDIFEKQYMFTCTCDCNRGSTEEYKASEVANGYKKACSICSEENSLNALTTTRYTEDYLKTLKNKRFGKLVIKKIYKSNTGTKDTIAVCDCDCGTKDKEIKLYNILGSIGTRACGNCRVAPNAKYDKPEYIGQTFNFLKVDSIEKEDGKTFWNCTCLLCGTQCRFEAHAITYGNNKSCGCMQSYNEEVIAKALRSRNINFKRQVTFPDLKGIRGGTLRFDFGIYDEQQKLLGLIEYDGEQHEDGYFNTITEYELLNNISYIQENDKLKNEYCKKNNIQLVRLSGYMSEKKFFKEMAEKCKKE